MKIYAGIDMYDQEGYMKVRIALSPAGEVV